jgi:predicted nucleic acid-binding Zn ribbon protein
MSETTDYEVTHKITCDKCGASEARVLDTPHAQVKWQNWFSVDCYERATMNNAGRFTLCEKCHADLSGWVGAR